MCRVQNESLTEEREGEGRNMPEEMQRCGER